MAHLTELELRKELKLKEISRLVREKQDVQGEMESLQEEPQSEIARLAYSRKNEIDPEFGYDENFKFIRLSKLQQ